MCGLITISPPQIASIAAPSAGAAAEDLTQITQNEEESGQSGALYRVTVEPQPQAVRAYGRPRATCRPECRSRRTC